MDAFWDFLKGTAVIAAIGAVGYLAVTTLGWDRTLSLMGVETTAVVRAPESQCRRIQDEEGPQADPTAICVSDRRWMRDYLRMCAKGEEMDLVYLDAGGAPTRSAKCPADERRGARGLLDEKIPRGFRVADFIESTR